MNGVASNIKNVYYLQVKVLHLVDIVILLILLYLLIFLISE